MLKPIKEISDIVIDTTEMKLSDLKSRIVEILKEEKSNLISITIISFGYKYGIPLDSDLMFDVRFYQIHFIWII